MISVRISVQLLAELGRYGNEIHTRVIRGIPGHARFVGATLTPDSLGRDPSGVPFVSGTVVLHYEADGLEGEQNIYLRRLACDQVLYGGLDLTEEDADIWRRYSGAVRTAYARAAAESGANL